MKKLNICLVSLKVYPDSSDGEAVVIRGYYDYLKKRGHNVKLLTGKWTKELPEDDIIQFELITKKFLWILHFNLKVFIYLKRHKFDLIHGNGSKGTLPIILSNKKNFITTIHDLGPFEEKSFKSFLMRLLIRFIGNNSPLLTTVSKEVKKEFKYFLPKVDQKRTNVVYNGISEKYKPYPEKAKKLKAALDIKGPVILYIGRIAANKDVGEIIKAYHLAKKNNNSLNLIVGGKPDFQMQSVYNNWKAQYKEIYFPGLIPEEKMPIYYSMGDVFVNYSHSSEGFGLTPIEAIACGTPVICSSLKVYKEVLEDNAVFVPPKRPEMLAEKIIMLLKDDNKRRKLTQKALKFIERYNWDSVGQKLEKVYYKFLNQ